MAEQPEIVDTSEWAGVRSGDNATRKALGPVARTIATIEGDCDACGFSIAVGDPIVLVDEGGEWIHARCAR